MATLILLGTYHSRRCRSAKPIARRFRSALISAPAILAIALSVLVVAPMVCSAIEINVEDIKAQYDKEQADNKAAKDAQKTEEKKAEKITKNANDAVELFYKKDAKVPTHSYEVGSWHFLKEKKHLSQCTHD